MKENFLLGLSTPTSYSFSLFRFLSSSLVILFSVSSYFLYTYRFFYLIGRFFRFTRACRHLQYHRVFFWIFRISAGSSLRQFRLASLFFPGVAGAAWEWLLRGKVRVECLSSWGCQVPVWLPPSRGKPSHPAIECPSCRNKCPSLWPGWKLEAKSQLLVLELV